MRLFLDACVRSSSFFPHALLSFLAALLLLLLFTPSESVIVSQSRLPRSVASYSWQDVQYQSNSTWNATTFSGVVDSNPVTATTAHMRANTFSEYLTLYNFSFSVPPAAPVAGLELSIIRKASVSSAVYDWSVFLSLTVNMDLSPTDHYAFPYWNTTLAPSPTYGGPADRWGWSATQVYGVQVNNAQFSALIAARALAVCDISISYVNMTVYYDQPDVTTGVAVGTSTTGSAATPAHSSSSRGSSNTLTIAVVTSGLAVLLLVAVGVVVCVLARRRRGSEHTVSKKTGTEIPMAATAFVAPRGTEYDKLASLQANSTPTPNISTSTYKPVPAPAYAELYETRTETETDRPVIAPAWQVNPSELTFERELGRGAYGIVFLGRWRRQPVAIKQVLMEGMSAGQEVAFRKEAELMMTLRPHQNVIQLLGVSLTPPYCIVTEFYQQGSVYNYLRKNRITEKQALLWGLDIAAGMAHLHLEGVVHRDLAARNLLLTDKLQVKISDFGLARATESENDASKTKSNTGPLKWMSPEAVLRKEYSCKSDVWAFGIVMVEILTGKDPYPDTEPLVACIMVSRDGFTHPIPPNCPAELASLLQQCWAFDPKERPTMADIYAYLEKL